MKPTWTRVVGILGIVFAVAGFLNSAQTLALPWMAELQTRMVTEIAGAAEGPGVDGTAFLEALRTPTPPWFRAWSILAGLTGLVISGFYLYGCIRLMEGGPHAHTLFIQLSFAALALALCRVGAVFLAGGLFLIMGAGIHSLASAGLHATLIAVVWANARETV